MAQRRMFSPDIVGSDAFLEMPTSTRELYFQLGMYADDDGFVNPKKIMRMINASEDDLKVLLAKRFLLAFENGVVVIKHWLIHNMIRKDRYKETQYVEQKKLLNVKENKAYTEIDGVRQPNGNQPEPQVRIGKDRLEENIVAEATPAIKKEYNFDDYLKSMEDHKARHIQVIAFYFKKKKLRFDTLEKAQSAIKRHLRAAREVSNFSDDEIVKAYKTADKEYPSMYTVETLHKILTR